MLEVELKSVVDDLPRRRAAADSARAVHPFEGGLSVRGYVTADRSLTARDEVLRVRVYQGERELRAELDWKGPTRSEEGYKLREELGVQVGEPDVLAALLGRLGFLVTVAIDREIAQYEFAGATVRFERYPRMDDLVEVEGTPEAIERAIGALGLPREGFTAERLSEFVRRFETRTGTPAALGDAELRGDVRHDAANV